MPTATPFVALGRGNGFPFCLGDYGTPPEPNDYLVDLSLANAMRPWWLIHSIRVQASWSVTYTDSTLSPPAPVTVNGSGDATALVGNGFRASIPGGYATVTVPIEPVERACMTNPTLGGVEQYSIVACYSDGVSTILWTSDEGSNIYRGPTDGLYSAFFTPTVEFDLGGFNWIFASPIDPGPLSGTPEERTVSAFGGSQTWYAYPGIMAQEDPINFTLSSFAVTIDEWTF